MEGLGNLKLLATLLRKDLKVVYLISLLILMETQISGDKVDKVINSLGFDGYAKNDALGRLGGI
ncbi:hypothetical protein Lal_00033511 [Lupinus albus]|nr:hypothetical protein Lal_00033511 [Lupinus albus]